MHQEILDYDNYTIRLSKSPHLSESCILFLHGFPAVPVLGEETEKNIDIAQNLVSKMDTDVVLLHYTGLGKSNFSYFSFMKSLFDSQVLCSDLLKTYKNVSLFGHSWGGFNALNQMNAFGADKFKKVYLHAPFNYIPERLEMKKVLKTISMDMPSIFNFKGINFYLDEFENLQKEHNPRDFKFKKLPEIQISQSLDDEEVSERSTRDLCQAHEIMDSYVIKDTDHIMGKNREVLMQDILEFYSS